MVEEKEKKKTNEQEAEREKANCKRIPKKEFPDQRF